jgi:hypothetical protein
MMAIYDSGYGQVDLSLNKDCKFWLFIEQATVATIKNYDCNKFIVQEKMNTKTLMAQVTYTINDLQF